MAEVGWATDQGEVRASEPAPGVLLFVERGYLAAAFVEKIVGVYERAIAEGKRPLAFIDGEHLTGQEPPLRADLTAWVRANRAHVEAIHMLVGSRLVKMAISVTNLALGGMMRTYAERGPFQIALNQAVARARPPTSRPPRPNRNGPG